MWVKIKRFENSKYNNKSKLIFFDINGKENYTILTRKVLRYLTPKNEKDKKITKLRLGQEIFVIFSQKENFSGYLIKNVK